MTSLSEQASLDLRTPTPQSFETFLINQSNETLLNRLRSPSVWGAPILALIGAGGSGKTHLARAFTHEHEGLYFAPQTPIDLSQARGRIIALDNAGQRAEESLFILLNMALNGDIPYLFLTDKKAPPAWKVSLPDLRSRLKNIPSIALSQPDEILLEPIIRKLFSDQGRDIEKPVVDYMLVHCSRDVNLLARDISTIEKAARAQNADVTKRFVAKTLKQK